MLGLTGACGSQLAYAQSANPPQQNRLDQQIQRDQERQVQEQIIAPALNYCYAAA
jgi:hypothetical protein